MMFSSLMSRLEIEKRKKKKEKRRGEGGGQNRQHNKIKGIKSKGRAIVKKGTRKEYDKEQEDMSKRTLQQQQGYKYTRKRNIKVRRNVKETHCTICLEWQ